MLLNLVSHILVGSLVAIYAVSAQAIIQKRIQPDAVNSPALPPLNPLAWGDVNFIHTTDTHGWLEGHILEGNYNADLGDFYSFTVNMKKRAKKLRKDLFIVDTGDLHDGNGLSDATDPKGKISLPLMKKIPYDILSIGNHELYVNSVAEDTIKNFIPHWNKRYLAANVYVKDANSNKTVQVGEKFTYFKGEFGTKVLAYGFIFDFTGNGNMTVVNKVENEINKDWFNASLKKYKPNVIALIGHIGLHFNEFKITMEAIRKVYPTVPIAVMGGHTHIRDFVQYDSHAAGIESGKYMDTVGFLSINGTKKNRNYKNNVTFQRRYLDQNRPTYIYHSVDNKENKFDTRTGRKISKLITKLRKEHDLSKVLGCAPQNYGLESVAPTDNSSIYKLIVEEIMPKIVKNPSRTNPAFYITNSGGVRFDIFKGPFTIDNMYQISPFRNLFYAIEDVPADIVSKLLDAMNDVGSYNKRALYFLKKRSKHIKTSKKPIANVTLTPGYITEDDFGKDGDDTKHIGIPHYDMPVYVASPSPSNSSSELIDVIYLDFFDDQLKSVLSDLTGGKTWVPNKNYINATINSSTMWVEYAKQFWSSSTC